MTTETFTKRQLKKLQRKHGGLRADRVKVGWWIFGYYEYEIRCSCGFVDPKRIPILPIEASMTTDYLLRTEMEDHLLNALKTGNV